MLTILLHFHQQLQSPLASYHLLFPLKHKQTTWSFPLSADRRGLGNSTQRLCSPPRPTASRFGEEERKCSFEMNKAFEVKLAVQL